MIKLEVLYGVNKNGIFEPHRLIVEANSEEDGVYKALCKLGNESIIDNWIEELDDYDYEEYFEDLNDDAKSNVIENSLDELMDDRGRIGDDIYVWGIVNLKNKEILFDYFDEDETLK